MSAVIIAAIVVLAVLVLAAALPARIVKQYEDGVLFRFGHPAPRQHETRHGQTSRGRTGEAREDHQRRRRVDGRRGLG
jgi:hypothetical protein